MERHIVLFADPEIYELYLDLVVEPAARAMRHEAEAAREIVETIDQAETHIETP